MSESISRDDSQRETVRRKGDYLYRIFGRLTVVENIVPSNGKNRGGRWVCLCSCGNTVEMDGYNLHSKKSCGCLRAEAALKLGSSLRSFDTMTINVQYGIHRGNAKAAGRTPLPREDWDAIVFQPCYYCGDTDTRNAAMTKTYQKQRGKSLKGGEMEKYAVQMNGVDRIDSSKGYDKGNVVPCCWTCNRMKVDSSESAFLAQVAKIYQKHCAAEHDRDTNAAVNIEAVGTTVLARGGEVRPVLAHVSGLSPVKRESHVL